MSKSNDTFNSAIVSLEGVGLMSTRKDLDENVQDPGAYV
jgi:hypothetical protein